MRPRRFAKFYRLHADGTMYEALGSDSVYDLDGRYSLQHQHDTLERIAALRNMAGYVVCHGTYSDNVKLSPIMRVNA